MLIKCKKCGHTSASKSTCCPNCGSEMRDNRLVGIVLVLVIFILLCIYFFIRTDPESEFKSENAVSVKATGMQGNISSPATPQVNYEAPERDATKAMVMHMLEYAMDDGGLSHESEIQQLKLQIEALPKPAKGNKKAARGLNADGLSSSKNYDFNNAVKMFEKAHEMDKSDIEIISNLGFSYVKQGNLDLAQQTIINALSMSPSRASAWADLGGAYGLKGDVNNAVACFSNTYRFSKDRLKTHQLMNKLNETEDVAPLKQARDKAIVWAENAYPLLINWGEPKAVEQVAAKNIAEAESVKQTEAEAEVEVKNAEPKYNATEQSETARSILDIQRKVVGSWIRPATRTQNLKCTIKVKLMSDGTVISAEVISSSGDEIFDRSAENAVVKASPLPIPDDSELFANEFSSFQFVFNPK